MTIPDGFRIERGFLWPATDVGAAADVFRTLGDLDHAYRHCRAFEVAVQAGGNCGVWPAAMAGKFRAVYTFEPEPVNFRCLAANAIAANVAKFQAALGDTPGTVGLALRPDNTGAHRIDGPGDVVTLTIDSLNLSYCDLIQLDIEGRELFALFGARDTINRCHPVVMVEDKGLSERWGVARGEIGNWLGQSFGYRLADTVNRDLIFVA